MVNLWKYFWILNEFFNIETSLSPDGFYIGSPTLMDRPLNEFFYKVSHSQPLFSLFHLFNTVDRI